MSRNEVYITTQSVRRRNVARMLLWVMEQPPRDLVITHTLRKRAQDCTCDYDYTYELCQLLSGIEAKSKARFGRLVYDARSKESRRLADWWEENKDLGEQEQVLPIQEVADRAVRRIISRCDLTEAEAEAIQLRGGLLACMQALGCEEVEEYYADDEGDFDPTTPQQTLVTVGTCTLADEFKEGQWWVQELDAVAATGTENKKRAVAVVHNLLRQIKAAGLNPVCKD